MKTIARTSTDFAGSAALPATTRSPVPDGSSSAYAAHHQAVCSDPRVVDLDVSARYVGYTSTDNGATWQAIPMPAPWGSVCGGHVQAEVLGLLLAGYDVVADGTTRILHDGSLVRWAITDPTAH